MDRKKAANVLEGMREKYRALVAMPSDFDGVHKEILEALEVALEALGADG